MLQTDIDSQWRKKVLKLSQRRWFSQLFQEKGVIEINRLLTAFGKNTKAELRLGTNHLKIMISDEVSLTTKLLEGAFPNYKKVIPSQTANPLYINKEVLRGGLNRAAVLASDRNPLVKMNITKKN